VIHKGDIIGMSGGDPRIQPSGHSSGSHLHLSIYDKDGILVNPEPYVLGQVQAGNYSPFLFPVMLIMLFIIFYKFRKIFAYGLTVFLILLVIFIVS